MSDRLTTEELYRLRTALRFYARRANHWSIYSKRDRRTPIERDDGARAVAALAILDRALSEIEHEEWEAYQRRWEAEKEE